jgi:2-polyprenyl-3-methyl-5-hydroxy-6-metoxy-1,4-benzoquinol methylase
MTDIVCTACNSPRVRHWMDVDGFSVQVCDACTHRFVSVHPVGTSLDNHYGEHYFRNAAEDGNGYEDYLAKSEQRSRAFGERLDWIERRCRRASVLDYGCAVGLFVKVAHDRGWRAKGYERSPWAAEYGRNVLGVEIEQGSGDNDPFGVESFDVVTLWDVFEHVEQPRQCIDLVRRWLKPGGLMALTTVNSSSLAARWAGQAWRHLAPPHHLQYFTRKSLLKLLDEHGFDLVEVNGSGTFLRSSKGRHRLAPVARALDGAITHWRMRPLAVALNLLDEVEVLARKR